MNISISIPKQPLHTIRLLETKGLTLFIFTALIDALAHLCPYFFIEDI